MALKSRLGNPAASRVDLGYMELLRDAGVTSVPFSSCDSVLADTLMIHQASQGSLHVSWGSRDCSACSAGESGLISL